MNGGRLSEVKVEGLTELQRDLKKAGASADDQTATKAVATLVAHDASSLVHSRTGHLASTIHGEATRTTAAVKAGSATVLYAGVNHYGWPSRGLSGTAKGLIGGLGSKGSRTFSDRTLRKAARQARRGMVRGGPYPANPFILRAIGQNTDEIHKQWDKWADGIARAVEAGTI
jgi:hypothetical protein